MQRILLLLGLIASLLACRKKTNPTPQLVSGKAFVVPTDSVVQVFKEKPVPPWASKKYSYKPSSTRYWDLIHTRLEVSFDWERQYMPGVATLTLEPYFYRQKSLFLDAKGFDIHKVVMLDGEREKPVIYEYDKERLILRFDTTFNRGQRIKIRIGYTARPNTLAAGGSSAITSEKGLYFINPLGEDPDKPKQIWTQGETESARCWFPTIDSPNERCTQEMYITVANRFKTLSNGQLLFSKDAGNGLRTDVWEMNLPHAPYLFMMAIGEFSVVRDKWRNKEVNYWVEPKYQPFAKKIFGNTPEMIEFFSKKLKYPFPWSKYDQVVVRDFVSGAMENTTASTFMEALQSTDRELEDRNWDDIIAHELFHQWFGDLVTLESWANLPLNESFANYSQYLWDEYKYGVDEADYNASKEKLQYLFEANRKQEPLIRYYNLSPSDMFDSHSYAKGGRVLHMLRKEVGDEAFFEALHRYLKTNEFKSVEIHQLRLAFEEVTGRDLNWFFNQWFFSPGHPELSIRMKSENARLTLFCSQTQDSVYTPIYRLPLSVEVWSSGKSNTYPVVLNRANDTLVFPLQEDADAVIFDSEAQLLGTFSINKSLQLLVNQYSYSSRAIHRNEALFQLKNEFATDPKTGEVFQKALKDSFWANRLLALEAIAQLDSAALAKSVAQIVQMASTDPKAYVRGQAVKMVGQSSSPDKKKVLENAMSDKSLTVSAIAYKSYLKAGFPDASSKMENLLQSKESAYVEVLGEYYSQAPSIQGFNWFVKTMKHPDHVNDYDLILSFGRFLTLTKDTLNQREGINILYQKGLKSTRGEAVIGAYQALKPLQTIPGVTEMRKEIKAAHKQEEYGEILDYLE